MAPDVGFEPTTKWLTATYSTAELIRNKLKKILYAIHFKMSRGLNIFNKFYCKKQNHTKKFNLYFQQALLKIKIPSLRVQI